MALPVKDPEETVSAVSSNRLKGLPREVNVGAEEHSGPRVICAAVHVCLEVNEVSGTVDPELTTKRTLPKKEGKEGQEERREWLHCHKHFKKKKKPRKRN